MQLPGKKFNEQLKSLRLKKGLTQKQLAEELDVVRSVVGHWETGIREPNIATLCRLADVLEVSLDYLTGRVDE